MRVRSQGIPHAAHIVLEDVLFGRELVFGIRILPRELPSDDDFLMIGKACQPHGCARHIALRVRGDGHNRIRGDRRGFRAPLAEIKRADASQQHREECGSTFHKYCRIFSRWRV